MHDVLPFIDEQRAKGEPMAVATVVKTYGSAPRQVGSKMIVTQSGAIAGSVSGGCIEDDLIDRHASALTGLGDAVPPPQLVRYGVTADEARAIVESEPTKAELAAKAAAKAAADARAGYIAD